MSYSSTGYSVWQGLKRKQYDFSWLPVLLVINLSVVFKVLKLWSVSYIQISNSICTVKYIADFIWRAQGAMVNSLVHPRPNSHFHTSHKGVIDFECHICHLSYMSYNSFCHDNRYSLWKESVFQSCGMIIGTAPDSLTMLGYDYRKRFVEKQKWT